MVNSNFIIYIEYYFNFLFGWIDKRFQLVSPINFSCLAYPLSLVKVRQRFFHLQSELLCVGTLILGLLTVFRFPWTERNIKGAGILGTLRLWYWHPRPRLSLLKWPLHYVFFRLRQMKSEAETKDADHENKIKLLITENNKLLQFTKVSKPLTIFRRFFRRLPYFVYLKARKFLS